MESPHSKLPRGAWDLHITSSIAEKVAKNMSRGRLGVIDRGRTGRVTYCITNSDLVHDHQSSPTHVTLGLLHHGQAQKNMSRGRLGVIDRGRTGCVTYCITNSDLRLGLAYALCPWSMTTNLPLLT